MSECSGRAAYERVLGPILVWVSARTESRMSDCSAARRPSFLLAPRLRGAERLALGVPPLTRAMTRAKRGPQLRRAGSSGLAPDPALADGQWRFLSSLSTDFIPGENTFHDSRPGCMQQARHFQHRHAHTSGFEPIKVACWNCGEDQCEMCKADMTQPDNHVAYPYTLPARPHMLMPPPPCPPLFKSLLTGEGIAPAQEREFKPNIRRLNSNYASASLTKAKEVGTGGRGPYVYKEEGQTVRRLSTAQERSDHTQKLSQVYFHDPAEARRALKQHPNVQNLNPWPTEKMVDAYNFIRLNNKYAL